MWRHTQTHAHIAIIFAKAAQVKRLKALVINCDL